MRRAGSNMRRSEYDVTDSVRTTDAGAVGAEVVRLFNGLYGRASARQLERAFADTAALYRGEHPDYHPCDTQYHDIQHVLDVTLAMARLLDGYGRRHNGDAPLADDVFIVGILAALFHDFGYLRRRHDRRHRYGAEYTLTHVSRGARQVPEPDAREVVAQEPRAARKDRKSARLNSSHQIISYAVFCLKKKKNNTQT